MIAIFVLATALLVADQSALAQRAVYSYPWCLERGKGGPRTCYYSSYEQCWQEAFTWGPDSIDYSQNTTAATRHSEEK
jgi:hypothetical protein